MKRNPSSTGRRLALSVFGATLAVAALAGGGCASDAGPAPPEPTASADPWRHVYLRLSPERYQDFEEGGGLIRSLSASEAPSEGDWWLGYFPRSELTRLRATGLEWQDLPSGSLRPQANTPGETCKEPEPGSIVDRFCPYRDGSYVSSCKRPIMNELLSVNADYPPVGGVTYAHDFGIGSTYQARRLIAARVGRIWKPGDQPIPQLVIYAGQHAREWAGPEAVMRLMRYFASSYRDDTNGVRDLLNKIAIVFIPVMNADGYDYTHAKAANRLWRGNREPCPGDVDGNDDNNGGTDPNRNFEATFNYPGSSTTCTFDPNSTYRGPSAGSAHETLPLLRVLSNQDFSGQYRTRFSLNVHAYGNFVLFPEGLGPSPFSICTTNSNCTAPDLGALQDLVGTELTTPLNDEETKRPYASGQIFRQLYATAGDAVTTAVYGSPSRPNDPRILSSSIEITNTECGFRAEAIAPTQFDALFDRVRDLTTRLADVLPEVHSGAAFPDFQLPHLHRRQPSGNGKEYPTMRVAALASLGSVNILGSGGATQQDDARDGALYRMWRYRSPESDESGPYTFPTEFVVCAKEKCEKITVDGEGEKIDLCDEKRFDDVGPGWKFQPNLPGGPQEECFWKHDGSGPGILTSGRRNLSEMTKARLVYSYRWQRVITSKMTVYVSNNGFVNCSEEVGTGCRIVRKYPYGENHFDLREKAYRTEIVDVSDFDHTKDVQIRFDVTDAANNIEIDAFDPVFVGWKG